MASFSEEKQRRIEQFALALAPMHERTVNIVKDCCFLILEEQCDSNHEIPSLQASQRLEHAKVRITSGLSESNFGPRVDIPDSNNEDWRGNEKLNRFVQFVFLEKHFEMDLPKPMLWTSEARQLLDRKHGFYFLGERPLPSSFESVIKTFQPLRKAFVHGDNHTAAEDIAHLFFELWRFPINARFFLSTFGGNHQWESGKPLD